VKLTADWVVGFVDGEGCFHVSLTRHPEMTAGYQVLAEFVVVQHKRDVAVLHALKRFFGHGVVRPNHGERCAYRVRDLDGLAKICDFFLRHPLKTRKNVDFRKFRRIVLLMQQGEHLSRSGLLRIIRLAETMNTQDRPALEQIRQELQSSLSRGKE
jgi:hypothetical protein